MYDFIKYSKFCPTVILLKSKFAVENYDIKNEILKNCELNNRFTNYIHLKFIGIFKFGIKPL